MTEKADLEKRLKDIEAEIEETKRRMPAHSVKPPIMIALIGLEDERDEILGKLAELSNTAYTYACVCRGLKFPTNAEIGQIINFHLSRRPIVFYGQTVTDATDERR